MSTVEDEAIRIMALQELDRYDALNESLREHSIDFNAGLVTRLGEVARSRGEKDPWGGANINRNPAPGMHRGGPPT